MRPRMKYCRTYSTYENVLPKLTTDQKIANLKRELGIDKKPYVCLFNVYKEVSVDELDKIPADMIKWK